MSPTCSFPDDSQDESFFSADEVHLSSGEEDSEGSMGRGNTRPPQYRLTPLRTKAEAEKSNEKIQVYVCEIPVKATGEVIEALKCVAGQQEIPLQHLRRVAKRQHRPDFLVARSSKASDKLWILLCPVQLISLEEIMMLLSGTSAFATAVAEVISVSVPRYPPLSAKHAAQLSRQHWPTVYTSTNPFGPHPTVVTKATSALEKHGNAHKWMRLAHEVARESHRSGRGPPIGTVVVERLASGTERVVCVAGDARFDTNIQYGPRGSPVAHSTLRAISMVADKRLSIVGMSPALHNPAQDVPAFQGSMSSYEAKHFATSDSLSSNGYLCLDLLVFTTHEPCMMCSMALVHSRIGGLIFRRAMKQTGGILAERTTNRQRGHLKYRATWDPQHWRDETDGSNDLSLKYGLFWRDDLNWRFLAWQWDASHGMYEFDKAAILPTDLHA